MPLDQAAVGTVPVAVGDPAGRRRGHDHAASYTAPGGCRATAAWALPGGTCLPYGRPAAG
jgi:hypothetical protein